MSVTVRRALAAVAAALFVLLAGAKTAPALPVATSPTGAMYHRITFPVAGTVHYSDDFGDCREGCTRHHQGNDLLGAKLMHELAAANGVIDWVRDTNTGTAGNMLSLKADDGYTYWYIHINNDTPGTDDGANPPQWRFAPGIAAGVRVKAGQFIAYMGDSGDAESTQPHLHFEMHLPNGTPIDPYTSLRLAQGLPASGVCGFASNPRPHPDANAGHGYWVAAHDGRVRVYGGAKLYPKNVRGPVVWSRPLVAMAATPSGHGYWLSDDTGRVVPFGDAQSYGGAQNLKLHAPIIGMTPTATGRGYWLLARDGGMFSYGDAAFYGSTGDMKLNAPIVGMASTPAGRGYWLLGADGGIFTFGNATFYGSTGNLKLVKPVMSMAATSNGKGYWLIAQDGGVFTFGNASYKGSLPATGRCGAEAAAMAGTSTGNGYWVLETTGKVDAFGDAVAYGDALGSKAFTITALK